MNTVQLPPDLERHRLVDEKTYCAIRGCSVKTAQNERWRGVGVPYRKIGKSVRYTIADILSFIDSHQKIVTRG